MMLDAKGRLKLAGFGIAPVVFGLAIVALMMGALVAAFTARFLAGAVQAGGLPAISRG